MKGRMKAHVIALAIVVAPLISGCGLVHAGAFTSASHELTHCEPVDGFSGGTEDIAVDYDRRRIYISAADRRGAPPANGAIYTMTFDDIAARRAPTPATGPLTNFHPHGIGLWTGADERRRLFVVNHPTDGPSRIDIFDAGGDGALRFTGISLQSPLIHRPNDVAPAGPAVAFVTNDRNVRLDNATRSPGPGDFFSALFGTGNGAVFYLDENGATRAAHGLNFANGILATPDGQRIWVAETGEGRVRVYARIIARALTLERMIEVGPGPDNLVAGADGEIWVGAHNNLLAFIKHRSNETALSPSRAFAITPDGRTLSDRIYPDPAELSAASVAAPVEDEIVLGGVYRRRLLVCPRPGADPDARG